MTSSTNLHHVYMNANLRCEASIVRMHANERRTSRVRPCAACHVYMNANLRCEAFSVRMHASEMKRSGIELALRSRGVRGLVLARIKA